MGPVNPPKEFAFSARRSGLFAISRRWSCACEGTAGRMSTICSRPMFMIVLGATVGVERVEGVTKDLDLTVTTKDKGKMKC